MEKNEGEKEEEEELREKRNESFLIKYRLVKHIESVHEKKNSNVKFATKVFL